MQRAVLILREVLGWSSGETAELLDTTVAATNSALQRARTTLRERLPERPAEWTATQPSTEERALLQRFIDTHERGDAAAAVALLREDIRVTIPPNPGCFYRPYRIAPPPPPAAWPRASGDRLYRSSGSLCTLPIAGREPGH